MPNDSLELCRTVALRWVTENERRSAPKMGGRFRKPGSFAAFLSNLLPRAAIKLGIFEIASHEEIVPPSRDFLFSATARATTAFQATRCTIGGKVRKGYIVCRMANRNSKRRAKAELKSRRQSGQKLVNPESKRAGGRRGMSAARGRRSAPMAA
jgi:hypothetical protein